MFRVIVMLDVTAVSADSSEVSEGVRRSSSEHRNQRPGVSEQSWPQLMCCATSFLGTAILECRNRGLGHVGVAAWQLHGQVLGELTGRRCRVVGGSSEHTEAADYGFMVKRTYNNPNAVTTGYMVVYIS